MACHLAWPSSIPAEDFAKPPEYQDAILSPDGKHIAIQRSADEGKTLVAVVQTKDLKLLSHIPATTGRSPLNPFWVNNERIVVEFTEESKSREHEWYTGELSAMDADGGKQRDIVEHQSFVTAGKDTSRNNLHGAAEVIHHLPKDKNSVIIRFREFNAQNTGKYVDLYKLNTVTGKVKYITKGPSYYAYFLLSDKGEPLFSIGYEKKSFKNENVLVVHQYKDKKWEEFKNIKIKAQEISVIAETENPNEVMIRASYTESADRIYRYNLQTGEKKLIFRHPVVDPGYIQIDPYTRRIIATHFEAGTPDIHLVDSQHLFSRWYPALYQAFPNKQIVITSSTKDGKQMIVHISGANEPGQFHLVNTETKKFRYLFNAAAWIKPELLAPTKPFNFKARDGKVIHGYITTPTNKAKQHPLVVMPHGGPMSRDWWEYDPEVQFLASQGYAVLQINFRGSSGHGYGFETAGYQNWGSLIQHDIIDATKWAQSQEYINADKTCISGASFGGYSALMSPILEPDLFKCAIGVVGVYDLELMWKTGDIEKRQRGENYLAEAIGNDPKQLVEFSPAKRAKELKIPVLLIHGKKDWRVDVKHYDVMKKALEETNRPPETLLFEREGHGFANEANRLKYFKTIKAFLDKNIGAK